MPNAIAESRPQNTFSKYPEKMDEFFTRNVTTIRIIPGGIEPDVEKVAFDFQIASASQYINFLREEREFWIQNDPKDKLKDFVKKYALANAISHFESANEQYQKINSSTSSGEYSLKQSISAIQSGILYSKSALAQHLLSIMDRGPEFLQGFRYGLSSSKNTAININVGCLEGFYAALEYRKFVDGLQLNPHSEAQLFEQSVKNANKQYTALIQSYTGAFHDQEARLKEIVAQTNKQIEQLNSDCDAYFKERDARCADLEKLYREKLRLEAPAEYWEELDKHYNWRGWLWLVLSALFTAGIVAGLVFILKHLPNMFSEDSHWIDVFKNSAIITVMTSIAVYILRLFVKMAVSSFHLSRDAKERNKLTYFYLALIEKNAVSEKERAIILNSLFSRADTGLLKGDASPTMSSNVSELVDILAKR